MTDAQESAVRPGGCGLLPALLIAALLLEGALLTFPQIDAVWRRGVFLDSDDAMRAVQLRDFLAGQGWFDLTAYRVDPPDGLVTHWSRIVDVPLAALHLFFSTFLPPDFAERATRLAFPFMLLAALYWIAGRLGAILAGEPARLAAIWLTALSAPMFVQFVPGRIDHHAPQIVTLAAVLCLLLDGLDRRRAPLFAAAAALMALSASISLENLPFFVVLAAAPALLFILDGAAARAQLFCFSAGALVAFPAFYALTVPPAAYLGTACDAFSFAHLAPVLVGALALLGVSILAPRLSRPSIRAVAVIAAAAVAFACALGIAPHCVDPFFGLDPSLRTLWLATVREVQPLTVVFAKTPAAAVGVAAPVALGLASALGLAWFAGGLARRRWLLAAAAIAVGLVLGLWQIRILTSATPLAMAPLAGAVVRLLAPLRLTAALRAALVAALCVPVSPIGLSLAVGLVLPPSEDETRGDDHACLMPEAFAPLSAAPPSRVLSTFGAGGHILAHTPHSVFAAPYHRNNHGNRIATDVFRAPPDAAEKRVRAAGVDFLLWCPAIDSRSPLVATAPSGLAASLLRGEIPAWLERRSPPDAPHFRRQTCGIEAAPKVRFTNGATTLITFDRRRFLIGAGALAAAPARAQPSAQELSDELQVRVENKSVPELCAEKDNIELDFVSPRLRSLQIQAVHPSYINTIVSDRWAPDWSSCDLTHDPKFFAQARRRTFWETPEFWMTGYTFPSFWRPNDVPIRVGDTVEQGFHLVQLWMWYRERAEEIMVFYPPDGYWRARPLPFEDMRWTAYGSSFLVGPVETQERPIVAYEEIVFDPQTRSFTLKFRRGGEARLALKSIDQERLTLDVSFDDAMPGGRPFAALRSMYAMETMSDAAIVAWRSKRGKGWEEAPVIDFRGANATEVWVGRHLPSRHNLSAPDMVFSKFQGASSK